MSAGRPGRWLLLRGLGREQRHWGAFGTTLADRLGVEVVALDLPGAGTQSGGASPASIAGIVDDLRRRWLELPERSGEAWGVLSVSLGGMVTLDWASRFSSDFAAAVVVNSSVANLSPPWRRMRPAALASIARAVLARDDAERERLVLSVTTSHCDDPDAVASEWALYRQQRPMSLRSFGAQLVAASGFRAPASVPVPLLVVNSAGDRLCDPSCSEAIARRYHAPLVTHATAGHDLGNDAGPWLAGVVSDWLERSP
jgi:pimeloyl-ACP methyl ester carboxylesterase